VILRRRVLPERLRPAHAAFAVQAERVQGARRVVLSCLPVGRVDPAPIDVGLDVLRDELAEVAAQLESWRVAEVEAEWRRCRESLEEATVALPVAQRVAAATGELEELLGAVEDVVEPLGDAWGAAERRWLALRERA
jgi:hypothetical protein